MGEYLNQNKKLVIKSINSKEMLLDDDSKWQFLDKSLAPLLWEVGNQIVIEKREGKFSDVCYIIINKTKKDQKICAVYGKDNISKEKKNEINKSLLEPVSYPAAYPEERLNMPLSIKKLLEENSVQLVDNSVWILTDWANSDVSKWETGQIVCVTKGMSRLRKYYMENLNVKGNSFIVQFSRFQE